MKLEHNQLVSFIDEICSEYCKEVSKNIRCYFGRDFQAGDGYHGEGELNKSHLHFSVLFSGSVYGEFILSLSKDLATEIVLGPGKDFDQEKSEVLDAYKEILNISVGKLMDRLGEKFDHLSLTSPKVTIGELYLPSLPVCTNRIVTEKSDISCSLYIDQMKLTMASELTAQEQKTEESELEKEQLKRLNKAKTEFLANMSHELRTPLNGMIGNLDLLRNTQLTNLQLKQIETVSVSGDFLLSIINDILEFSKIEAGQLEIETRAFNFVESFDQLVDIISNQIFQKNLNFIVDIDPSLPTNIVSDETRLKQVLMNLIGNAIKFTPNGEIKVSAEKVRDTIKFSVSDTGVGIPSSKIETIFHSFAQADVSDNRKYGGSGLGLTISKSIIEALGGSISVESEEAKGTTFSFVIPLEPSDDSQEISDLIKDKECKHQKILSCLSLKSSQENLAGQVTNLIADFEAVDLSAGSQASCGIENKLLFAEWSRWMNLDHDQQKDIVDNFKNTDSSVCFLLKPDDFESLDEQSSLLEGLRGTIVKLPLTPMKLTSALNSPEPLTFKTTGKENIEPSSASTGSFDRVLLVEDNMINQQVAKAMLELIGLTVDLAGNGKEAVELCHTHRYDMIFMDCQMPVMDGYEATKAIRDNNQNKSTPIIALTANAFREVKEKCFEFGMTDFATKPIKKENLEDLVKRYSN